MPLDPRIETIREKYGLDNADFWELPQKKGTWLVKHSALEIVAAKAHIVFDNPQVIESNTEAGIAVVSVAGQIVNENNRREWSIGEASPKNNKNAYPWAMAEKRAKDRVILKLSGIHGLVYSEEEMAGSDRAPEAPAAPMQISSYLAKKILKTDVVLADIDTAKTLKRCDELEAMMTAELAFLPGNWLDAFRERIRLRRIDLNEGITPPTAAETANAALDRQYSETIGK
jgi:hypothetical protein